MDLTLYSASWCRDCREAKRFLTTHNIPYKEVDIETTPGAADAVIANTGKRAIPQFVLDGKWVQPYKPGQGFLYDEMSELLKICSAINIKSCHSDPELVEGEEPSHFARRAKHLTSSTIVLITAAFRFMLSRRK
jgi:glutaredoxin